MVCSICLEPYTADERPAALPCGHIFHASCLQDWLTARSHGALSAGCPLCKAPASSTSIVALWPSDSSDFQQYVAMHGLHANKDAPHTHLLSALRDMVQALQSYAMAAHGLSSTGMQRARHSLAPIERIVPFTHTEKLESAVQATEALSRELSQRHTSLDEQARILQRKDVRLRSEKSQFKHEKEARDKEYASFKQKQKHMQHLKRELQEKKAKLDARAQSLERDTAEQISRMQDQVSQAKSTSAEAIRRAALSEEAASERIAEADERARQADERAADMAESLEQIRQRNQVMADQMRSMQAALSASKKKRHAEREELEALRSQVQQQGERSALPSSSPLRDCDVNIPRAVAHASPSKRGTSREAALVDDLDDTHFPMPGGALTKKPRWDKPQATPRLDAYFPTKGGQLALGPRYRVP